MFEKKNKDHILHQMLYSFDDRQKPFDIESLPTRLSNRKQRNSLIKLIKCQKEPFLNDYHTDKSIPKHYSRINSPFESLNASPERDSLATRGSFKLNLNSIHSSKNISIPAIKYLPRESAKISYFDKRISGYEIKNRRGFTSESKIHHSSSKGRERRFKHPRICFSNKRNDK